MPDRRRYARTPDTILLLTACAVTSGALTLLGQVPASVLELAPLWLALVWSGSFALSAATALAGVLWRDALTGWFLELAGRVGLTFTATGYVLALVAAATQWGTALVVAIVAGIAMSSGWRAYQLVRRLDEFRATLRGAAR
jgi:hypothetical protein